MRIFHRFRLLYIPPRIADPEFGRLLFQYMSNAPETSYWEGQWRFPKTGAVLLIGLPGDERGPFAESRQFYLGLPGRFEQIIGAVRPKLAGAFKTYLQHDLPQDIFGVVKLTGFDVEDSVASPVKWNISFETIGDKWLGITIPFVGDVPQEETVDT